ncbi:MAG: hypothetical protein KAV83_12660 [Desulfobacterales bacterium]|nr:hypothetical protein [Desulfobacterales bacterium]
MSYEAYLTETFQKSVKILRKKYRSVKDDLSHTIQILEQEPTMGDPIPGWNRLGMRAFGDIGRLSSESG